MENYRIKQKKNEIMKKNNINQSFLKFSIVSVFMKIVKTIKKIKTKYIFWRKTPFLW